MESIGPLFMELTKFPHLEPSAQSQGEPQPPLQIASQEHTECIMLPEPEGFPLLSVSLLEFIELRTSVRRYSADCLSLEELALLLWCTQGVKMVIPDKTTFRNVPSAGARHAFETYLLVNRVDGLEPGLYRYVALEHELQLISDQMDLAQRMCDACLGQAQILGSAVTFIWTAVAERMTWRYGQRGYRYLYLDAGHVCQNLYLSGEAIGCGVCALAAFDDDALNVLLGLDGEEQFAVYLATLGRK